MTREEKDLVLRDLCARLPYGIKVLYNNEICTIDTICSDGKTLLKNECGLVFPNIEDSTLADLDDVKPYLRPMSSMTEEERKDFVYTVGVSGKVNIIGDLMLDYKRDYIRIPETTRTIDWLNEHHFDYRGLIEQGLAILTEEFNPYED